ncbi:MAG: 30S ribosomal protein S20 [Fimbriimonadaceae bacterium]|nr:30S ribosomal protein S20 [Fimbriimonadaceae bacterium]
MANIQSMKKDLKRNAKARAKNLSCKSALKTYVKKVRVAAATGDKVAAGAAATVAVKMLDKAAQRGIIHKNQAARRKSRAMKAANKAVAAATK